MAINNAVASRKSKEVYEMVKEKILTLELKRGQHLSERGLAKELGVARATLRDSLIFLTQDNLVEKIPGVGSFVKSHQAEDIVESLEVRRLLEGHAAKRTAENITASQAKELKVLAEKLETAFQNEDDNSLNQLDMELHTKIADFSGNSQLKQTIFRCQTVRYLLIHDKISKKIDYSEAVLEHKGIISAIIDGHVDEAEKLMKEHIDNAIDRFLEKMRNGAT